MARAVVTVPPGDNVVRVVAHKKGMAWLYQYPPHLWAEAVERIMADLREGKIPEVAARGLVRAVSDVAAETD